MLEGLEGDFAQGQMPSGVLRGPALRLRESEDVSSDGTCPHTVQLGRCVPVARAWG